jgi:FkbM family methyltransferase
MKLHVRKRIRNAWKSFTPDEINYKLGLETYSDFQVAFRRGTADERVIKHSFDNDIFLTGTPEYQPKADDVILDVGAHIGTFALLAASHTPRGSVHAIEASRESYNYLHINAALNPSLPIKTHHLALAGQNGEVTLHHDRKNWGHSIMQPLSAHGERVTAQTLPTFMEQNDIRCISFMKFNCEGAEFPILMETPVETLRKVGAMLILYHLDLVSDHTLPDLIAHLSQAGFETTQRNVEGDRGWIIAHRPS